MPEYQLSANIHYHKTGTKLPHESTQHLCPDIIFNQQVLGMHIRGEPLSTTLKVVMALMT